MSEDAKPPVSTRNASVGAIFLTVFLDLLGFGLFIPDLQLRGRDLAAKFAGPSGTVDQIQLLTGVALAVFSLAQLLTAPALGRWSDRAGRRKVLILSTVLNIFAYVMYAHANTYGMVFGSRILSGIAAANLGVAFAYVADITTPENRSKGLGAIGAAFGLGFVLGPPFGSFLLTVGKDNPLVLGYVGAFLAIVNLVYIVKFLPESVQPSSAPRTGFLTDLRRALSDRHLALMLMMFFCINLCFTNLEATFFQLLADPRSVFHLQPQQAKVTGGFILMFVGIIAAIMQGGVVRQLTPKFGEVKLLRWSYLLFLPSFVAIPFSPLWAPALVTIAGLGIANGLAQPSLSSLISRSAPREIQGGIFGVTQALGALARTIGPLISNPLLAKHPSYPYLLGGGIALFPVMAAWTLRQPKASGEPAADPVGH